MIDKDKLFHASAGAVTVIGAFAVIMLYSAFGWGPAFAFASTAVGIGYEVVQKLRNEGHPDPVDAAFTAAPGWLAWALIELTRLA